MASKALSGISPHHAQRQLAIQIQDLYSKPDDGHVREKVAELEPLATLISGPHSILLAARLAIAEIEADPSCRAARESLDHAIEGAFEIEMNAPGCWSVLPRIMSFLCQLELVSTAEAVGDLIARLSSAHPTGDTDLVSGLQSLWTIMAGVTSKESAVNLFSAAHSHTSQHFNRMEDLDTAVCTLQRFIWELLDQGRLEQALEVAKDILGWRMEVGNSQRLLDAHCCIAAVQEEVGLPLECLESIRKAAEIAIMEGVTNHSVMLGEATALMLLGRYDEAEACLMAIRSAPSVSHRLKSTLLHKLPELHFLQGKNELALQEVDEILHSRSHMGTNHHYSMLLVRGDILAEAGKVDDAMRAYEDATSALRDSIDNIRKLMGALAIGKGRALRRAERWQEAEQQLVNGCEMMTEMLLGGHPRLVSGLRELAYVRRMCGRYDGALEEARKSLNMARMIFGLSHEETALCQEEFRNCKEETQT